MLRSALKAESPLISDYNWQGNSYQLMVTKNFPEEYDAGWIYYHPGFLQLQPGDQPLLFQLLDGKGLVLARMVIIREGETALSLPQAPFGGVQLLYNVPVALVNVFINFICEILIRLQFRKIKIIQPSYVYQDASVNPILTSLENCGFRQQQALANYHIDLAKTPSSKISKSSGLAIKKCLKEGFDYHHRIPYDRWVYQFVSDAYHERGYRISLKEEQLNRFFKKFPQHYWVCAVFDGKKPAAVTVVVEVSKTVLYTFYIAYSKAYSNVSPSKFLIHKLSQRAEMEGYRILDLGLVSDQGKHLPGLETFKRLVGGKRSSKHYLFKNLK